MKLRIRNLLELLLLITFLTSSAQVSRIGQSGMTFLDIDLGARSAGMGGAFVGMDGDAGAIFWNPAGIANIGDIDFVVSENSWLADINVYSMALAYGLGKYGVLGVGFIIMDNPDVRVTSISYASGVESWQDHGFQDIVDQHALGITYARQITDFFSVGGQIKWIHEDFGAFDYEDRADTEVSGGVERARQVTGWKAQKDVVACEFGTQYYAGFKDLRVAFAIRNFAPRTRYQLEYFELPLSLTLGMAMNVLSVIAPNETKHALTMSVNAIHPRDFDERIQVGGEYCLGGMLTLRAGYKFGHDLEGLATGFGIRKSFGKVGIRIDYAYSVMGSIFDNVHRFSFGLSKKKIGG